MGKRTWTEADLQVLYDNFPEGGIYKCIELLPHKTRKQIKAKIDALHIKSNHYEKWTKEENERLKEAWENYSMKELLDAFPGRSYQKIQLHANQMGYHSKTDRKRKSDLSFLDLNNLTPENAYWWGFIMADGHLSRKNELIVCLKDTDFDHLNKLANHLKCELKKRNGFCRLSCGDKKRIEEWKTILKMEETAKTYFPPELSIFEENFVYFFIGFVDGDGNIKISKNYPGIKIEIHGSWKEKLKWFANILKEKYDIMSVNVKDGKKDRWTSVLEIGNRNDVIKLSTFAKNVDCMKRKWEKIFTYKPTKTK